MHVKYGVAQEGIDKTAAQSDEDEVKTCAVCEAAKDKPPDPHICPNGKKE